MLTKSNFLISTNGIVFPSKKRLQSHKPASKYIQSRVFFEVHFVKKSHWVNVAPLALRKKASDEAEAQWQ
ncbi:hypothetical protein HDEF_0407 [Candidatus Hamiltonella defensa 5AT (Acyrthosiphon pisum)]|uniref:Uncharacterized protein n=1 Tax=Hamiltonella defensa subsp. Acyrthosiphon pisum (strain 5AT) TaxID=572265 RepID=C4K3L9_HAMD5|nr:hypothetical protein HDEF_0407 [Candidatus Hamiltonella defensa 5AT (Acyrthosiphon pisum)]